ncbi:hypothetical protein ACVIGV_001932 [Rhizobium leguminosarum]
MGSPLAGERHVGRQAFACLPSGHAERRLGRVIFIASESGFNVPVEMIHYGVSKTADIAVARGLAKRAHVLVSKYADHLPLYRQAQIMSRQGIDLDRSTLADWVGRAAFELRPVFDALIADLKRSMSCCRGTRGNAKGFARSAQ